MNAMPTRFDLDPENRQLVLTWTDGEVTRHDYTRLRRLCPCANCQLERDKVTRSRGLRILSKPTGAPPEPGLQKVEPVGRYALRFEWEDGHSAGIYPYALLRQDGQK